MLVEIDEAAVDPRDDLAELRRKFDGMTLYLHALPVMGGEEIKTLRELERMGVIESVTLHAYK